MMATLNSYESMFGPYHLQTLALAVQIARVLWSVGETHSRSVFPNARLSI